jgi:hypothetical protein
MNHYFVLETGKELDAKTSLPKDYHSMDSAIPPNAWLDLLT